MLVCVVHTDFRLYWPARLEALRSLIEANGGRLQVIEIAGKGSPYAFAQPAAPALAANWECLFPNEAMESISSLRASSSVWRALETHQPDVVLAGAIAYPSGATAVRWARARNRGVAIMDNARRADVPRSALTNWAKRRIYANVDSLFLPSPSHIPDYEFWGVAPQNMFFGVNVVDNRFFAERSEQAMKQASSLKASRGLPQRFLLGVGRQIAKKNWTGLIEAWRMFKQASSDSTLRLVLVGNGPLRPTLVKQVRQLPAGEVLLCDFASQKEMAEYYGLAAGLVLPSLHAETWGLVVNEAMASGLPVLVSRQCGCAQTLVEPGRNGWVFDGRDHGALVQALLAFDAAGPQIAQFGERSRLIINQWGLERFCEGAWKTIQHAAVAPRRQPGFLDRCMLRLWKGRYRPV